MTGNARGRVLVITDQTPLTRRVAERLSAHGHEVTVASPQALEAAHAAGELTGTGPHGIRGYDAVCDLQPPEVPPRGWLDHQFRLRGRRRQRRALRLLGEALATAPAVRLIQRSTASLYRDGGHRWISETDPVEPRGLSVIAHDAELMAARHQSRGGVVVTLRLAHLYAPDHHGTIEAVRLARKGWEAFHGRADAYFPTLHADDAASAFALALTAPPGTYNVSDARPSTNEELNQVLAHAVGQERVHPLWPVYRRPDQAVVLRSCRLDASKFIAATGWNATVGTACDGLPGAVSQIRGNQAAARVACRPGAPERGRAQRGGAGRTRPTW